jgi:predicted nucleic acid-binding protein
VRIVLDTNALLAAFASRGMRNELFERPESGRAAP